MLLCKTCETATGTSLYLRLTPYEKWTYTACGFHTRAATIREVYIFCYLINFNFDFIIVSS